ncbi:ribbon-helix-helix domain-containing protein [Fictibacillus phosphorivorans]|uniref:ribbon-helix-helix domain-containing protein n=1 Tax=Fictibacillus phosphorivorans TaxID=1221500 RepID=UPI000A909CA6
MAVDKEKDTQILVTFPKEMVTDIVKYWHDHKIKNRNEAIRQLIEKALKDSNK